MKIKIIAEEGNELKIEIEGESHTLGNLLQQELLEDKKVEIAGYDVPHPLINSAIIYIRTLGRKSPRKSLKEALIRLQDKIDTFQENVEKIF
ncbi:DNA-directed RNA polymerase subunit L [[Eubacterium] cellulosolvens]